MTSETVKAMRAAVLAVIENEAAAELPPEKRERLADAVTKAIDDHLRSIALAATATIKNLIEDGKT